MAHTLINFDIQQKIRKEYCKILTVHMSYIRLIKRILSIRSEITTGPKEGLHLDLKMAKRRNRNNFIQ